MSKSKTKKVKLKTTRSEEHTSELQSRPHLVCRLLLEKKKNETRHHEVAEEYITNPEATMIRDAAHIHRV